MFEVVYNHDGEALLVEGMAFWLKAATTAFTFKNLSRHYVKQSLTHCQKTCYWVDNAKVIRDKQVG